LNTVWRTLLNYRDYRMKHIFQYKSNGNKRSCVALHTSKDGENLYRKFGFSEPFYPYLELVLNAENFKH
jgi:hypothetical protein